MAFIENFMGGRVEIPEDRYYDLKQGLWAKKEADRIDFGLTQPALILLGGLNDLEWLVPSNKETAKGETILFAITGKILYLEAPLNGVIEFNVQVKDDPSLAIRSPYDQGWLFRITPTVTPETALKSLGDFQEYLVSLQTSEGCKNPQGLKGGVSGICKAVYSGIREQKLERKHS